MTGTQNYVARDSVCFKAGFYYSASAGQTLKASTADSILCSAGYLSTQINSDTWQLDQSKEVGTTLGSATVSASGAALKTKPANAISLHVEEVQ